MNPVRKEALFKRLGKMDMVVEKLRTFKELLFTLPSHPKVPGSNPGSA